ncbi:MAG: hypothetical protein JWL81_2768 [Verrucomicrobiales bacterium]|nr:hypothetical protein [Verrucomicrobiales bacterium]
MSEPDQLIITCAACGGRLRTPRSSIGSSVGCPSCDAIISVRDPAAHTPVPMIVDPRRRMGPSSRETSPVNEFKERLRSTSEATFAVDPDNPVMKRRDHRRAKHGGTLTDWDAKPRVRQKHGRRRHLVPILSILAGIAVITFAAIFWARLNGNATSTDTANTVKNQAPVPLELQATGDFRSQVWDVVRRFCTAPNPAALIPLIRDPDRVGPKLLKYYTSENPWIPLSLTLDPDLSDLKVHRSFVLFNLPLTDYTTRPIALEQTPEGFRVDWESFTGYSDLSWADLRRTRPREPVVLRAVLRPSDYFNLDFPNAQTHYCYQLSDLNSDHTVYGYVLKGGDVELQIAKILLNESSIHAVLRVRYPEKSTNDRQLEITEVLEKGWVFREDDSPETQLQTDDLLPSAPPTLPVQSSPGEVKTRPDVLPRIGP